MAILEPTQLQLLAGLGDGGGWMAVKEMKSVLVTGLLAVGMVFCGQHAESQQPTARISGEINTASRLTIAGSQPPRARSDVDAGAVASDLKLEGITIAFNLTPAQQTALDALIIAQQNPASPLYHQWLTPEQYAASFGMATADLEKVEGWLQSQGFAVSGVSRSRDRISFSGTEGQVQAAFGVPLHYYKGANQSYYAPSADLSVPAALGASVVAIGNLSSFRARSHVVVKGPVDARPNFTSSQSGNHFMTPKDVATIYDVNAAYNAGFNGTGQSIAIVGQSAIVPSDITNFQTAAGVTANTPVQVLVPGSGTGVVSTGDEGESDLDLEYSSTIAKNANIFFVYTGNNTNFGVFDALTYAVDNKLAGIISTSYGLCETSLGQANYTSLNTILAQGATQGQSIISASGDDGSTDCNGETTLAAGLQTALAVDFPGSSQYVTSLGGSEFPTTAVAAGAAGSTGTYAATQYWSATTGSDVVSSALSYIPEQAWNDDSTSGLSSGGGGASVFTARPTWQTGVTGIPSGTFRLVPDISLDASPNNAGYLYCSSDTSTGVTGSCTNGFRDSSNSSLTVAGGTSFAAPIFSAMLALINQSRNSPGQGLINPTLYTLAGNATTYATAFHDITSGNNACPAALIPPGLCTTAGGAGFSATTGYDEATGLGSIDLFNMITAWPKLSASALSASTTLVTAASASPVSGAADLITITVAPGTTTLKTTPTGTVSISVDGTVVNATAALTNGVASYTFSSTTAGAHVISVAYSGDSVYAASTGYATVTVGSPAATTGTFSLSASALTIAQGGSGASTITITPATGYTGTVAWTVSTSPSLANSCATLGNATVSGTAAVTAKLMIYTSNVTCNQLGLAVGATGQRRLTVGNRVSSNQPPALPGTGSRSGAIGLTFAGLVLTGLIGRRSRRVRSLVAVFLLATLGFGLSGCGGSSTAATTTTSPVTADSTKGTYTVTVTGTDTLSPSLTASTTFTLIVN